jgi:hypothetical protein
VSIDVFKDYLERLELDFTLDEENDAIDIAASTAAGVDYTIALVAGRTAYSLFVSPLVAVAPGADLVRLYARLLELNDERRFVRFSLDADGDVKVAAEGFARLDAFGQFRRRVRALTAAVDAHGEELAELAGGRLL